MVREKPRFAGAFRELGLDGDDKRMGPGITMSRRLTVGMLKQGYSPEMTGRWRMSF